ncbi:uncharacterized protein SAPINGB_P004254 [Magnusiomyces paraingens]|uniref:Cytochrome P450 n=1 Tax=Magnusiomyces paraingens TaxID=2606893 RepID=A0A5E8BUH8_9ASCO|nr:uncharacterized protein SAPINGB_P004254 [Saprochaete ingens]VVT54771.1 unnamed protein product [Saprochaete ingens]
MSLNIIVLTALAGPLLIIVLLIVIPLYQDAKYRFQVWRQRGSASPPGIPMTSYSFPFGIPFLLNIIKLSNDKSILSYFLVLWEKRKRTTVRQQVFGQFNIVTNDPENIKSVLSVNFKDYEFGVRHGAFAPLLGDGIFTLDGAGWKHSRAMLRPQFRRQQIAQLGSIERNVGSLISILKAAPGEIVDLQALFFQLTIDTATEFLFGESVQTLSGGNPKIAHAREFGEAFNAAQAVLLQRVRLNSFYSTVNPKEFQQWCATCKTFTDSYVQMALGRAAKLEKETDSDNYVFLDQLVKETRDPQVLRDQALNILLAGRDTTASLLSWIFYNLAIYPEIFAKLRAEILAQFGDTPASITFESLKQCTYLRYVINETLRLFPIVPGNGRTAIRDTYLPRGGVDPANPDDYFGSRPVFVPKGTTVGYSVYMLHHNPYFWGIDAAEFRPERWSEPRPNAHSWDYLPFNGGPRICLGQQFALTEAAYVVVRLLQTFGEIRGAEGLTVPPKPETQLTMNVYGGVPLALV